MNETPWLLGMRWVINRTPRHCYRFLGYFCNSRWRKPNPWQWVWEPVGSELVEVSNTRRSTVQSRARGRGRSRCFTAVIASRRWGRSSRSCGRFRTQNSQKGSTSAQITSTHTCTACSGESHTGQLQRNGTYIPDQDAKFEDLKMRLSFNDLDKFKFDIKALREYAPCELDFLKGKTELPPLPNHIR